MRDFSLPGRSIVHCCGGMAATSHPLATATALDLLRRNGTAMDAAIAAAAVLAVVEPAETGIGGDCFALYAPQGRVPPIAFNGSGRAPATATLDWFSERGISSLADNDAHSVTVPGAIDAWWELHKRFGSLEFETLLQPAIHYAREGHVVHERVAHEWQVARDRLCHDPSAASIFLPGGHTPQPGQIFRNPALAKSLDLIARKGRKGFYEGELAQSMVAHLRERGGLHTLEDFASAQGEFVDPIAMPYRGSTVYQLPPNTQGIIALLLLALLEECEGEGLSFDDPRRIHLAIEAARIAFSVRNDLLGDMDTLPQPTCRLLNHNWVCELAGSINPMRASTILPPVRRREANTVYLTVVDRDRNVASFINSIFHSFGSGLCPPDTGTLLQNRGVNFQLDPQHANVIGPGRRPMHTIIPGMVGIGDRATLAFGVMGGDYQPVGHAHVLSALYKYDFDLQAACDAPRYMPSGDSVEVETGIDQQLRDALTTFGHHVTSAEEALGGAQLISLDWERGILSGASDPRKDGCALGF